MPDNQLRKGSRNMTTSPLRKAHYLQYKMNSVREKHKLKRILKSSGVEAAREYASQRNLIGLFLRLTQDREEKA